MGAESTGQQGGVVGYPETTCQDWVMGSTGRAVAWVMSMLIGRAGGGTGLGTDSTVVGT